jgi:hypothetical protein
MKRSMAFLDYGSMVLQPGGYTMKHNVCGLEKYIRMIIGVAIISAGLFYGSWLGAIGLIPLVTAFVGYCPVTHALRLSSCPVGESPSSS